MPRKKALIPRRKRYTLDLKRRVVYQRHILLRSTTAIAIELDLPRRVVQRVLQRWDECGEVSLGWRGGRKPLLVPEECEYVLALLEHTPDLYLDEIQLQLYELHGVKISVKALSCTLERMGVSSKKVCLLLLKALLFFPSGVSA